MRESLILTFLKIQMLFVTFTHPLIIIIMTELYQRLAIYFNFIIIIIIIYKFMSG